MYHQIQKLDSAKFKQDLVNKVNEIIEVVNELVALAPQANVVQPDIPVQTLHGRGNGDPESISEISKER